MNTGSPDEFRSGGFLASIKAVGASFFGVRGRRAHESDFSSLNPIHVIVAGVLMALVFIAALVLVVRAVVS